MLRLTNNYFNISLYKLSKKLSNLFYMKKTLSTDTTSNDIRNTLFAPMQLEDDKKLRKISIIGVSGNVGQIVAYHLVLRNFCDEIVLHSVHSKRKYGIGLDLMDGTSFNYHPKIEVCENGEKTKNSDLLIVCAGVGPQVGQKRIEILKVNVDVFKKMIPPLANLSPNSVILVVSNPVDIMAYAAWKFSGFPYNRVIGTGTSLDSSRLKIFLSKKLGISPKSINAWMIGEHGGSCVTCWSTINVAGTRLKDCYEIFGLKNDPDRWFEIEKQTIRQGYVVQKLRGFTNYAIAMCVTELAEAILMDNKTIHSISTNCDNVYGFRIKSFLSLPAVIGNKGVHKIIKLTLDSTELKKFKKSASILDKALNSYKWDQGESKECKAMKN